MPESKEGFKFNKGTNTLVLFGIAMALLLMVLRFIQWRFWIVDRSQELYMAGIALLFTAFGVWLATMIVKKKNSATNSLNSENEFVSANSQLSERESEILLLISQGKTNQEIADHLFLSISTIKSHISNIFEKLDVKNRTQALDKARKLNILQREPNTLV